MLSALERKMSKPSDRPAGQSGRDGPGGMDERANKRAPRRKRGAGEKPWPVKEISDPTIQNPRFDNNEAAWAAGWQAVRVLLRPIFDEMLEEESGGNMGTSGGLQR